MAAPIVDITSLTFVELTRIINMRPPKWGLFTTFFKDQTPSNKEVFEVHTKVHGQDAIPVVSNYSPGVIRQPDGWEAAQVKATRFRTKREFKAADILFERQMGQTIYDSAMNNFSRRVAEDMDGHRQDHDYMLEIMCSQAVTEAKVNLYAYDELTGTNVVKQIIDFGRPATHDITVSASDKWSINTTDLLAQIEDAHRLIMEDCNGYAATELIMGQQAWNAFRKHSDVQDSIDKDYRLDVNSHINLAMNASYRGYWNGLNLYVYNGWYVDVDGTQKYYLDPNSAVLLCKNADNVIEHARPVDLDCSGPTAYFAKSYKQEDPSGYFTVAESRPLVICYYPAWSVIFRNCA